MICSVLLIIAVFSSVCGASEPLDSVPPPSRNGFQHGTLSATTDNASQLAELESNNAVSPSDEMNLMGAASKSYLSVLEGLQVEMQLLQTEIQQLRNETAAKEQVMQAEIQQLQNELAANELRIQDLEQRDYIERCESGVLLTPADVFTSGYGVRSIDLTATFSSAFRTVPVVSVGLWYLDNLPGHIRVSAHVMSVSTTSISVQIHTWADSQLFSARVYWMACA